MVTGAVFKSAAGSVQADIDVWIKLDLRVLGVIQSALDGIMMYYIRDVDFIKAVWDLFI